MAIYSFEANKLTTKCVFMKEFLFHIKGAVM